mgnify:FL=1
MIYEVLKKHKHVMEYDEEADIIKKSDIVDLLKKTWEITPSKNNLMPWQVFVIGPDNQNYKNIVYNICSKNEDIANSVNEYKDNDYIKGRNPAYANIKSCQYLLIMTQRLSGPLNAYQQKQWDNGVFYDSYTEEGLADSENTICIECGIFGANFSALAIEKEIDTSYTLCFTGKIKYWKELPFINRPVTLLMTIGHGKKYRKNIIFNDPKPNFERIVKLI